MKKLYDNFYKIEEDKPIRENVFLARIATSVIIIVFCLFSMGFAAYGFFSADLSSSSNVITTASYHLDVSVSTVPQGEVQTAEEIQATSGGIYLLDVGTYVLTLCKPDVSSMASTGFASISLYDVDNPANVETYYTKPIGKMLIRDEQGSPVVDENGEYTFTECNTRNFTIEIKEKAHLSVVACWGSYSDIGHDDANAIVFGTAPKSNKNATENLNDVESDI